MRIDGGKLKRVREAKALSLRELADQSGVDFSAISRMELGKRAPHPKTLRKLAEALGVEPSALLNADGGNA